MQELLRVNARFLGARRGLMVVLYCSRLFDARLLRLALRFFMSDLLRA